MPGAVGRVIAACSLGLSAWIAGPAAQAAEPIVLGLSLSISAGYDGSATRIIDGTKAYIGHVNAQGGVNGRPLELVTLDDASRTDLTLRNVRELARERKAVALLSCNTDARCAAVARAATELHIPLVGALSGSRAMARQGRDYLFPIRPGYEREADAMARQLGSMGASHTVVLIDAAAQDEAAGQRLQALRDALAKLKVQATVVRVDRRQRDSLDELAKVLAGTPFHAAVMDLTPETIDALADAGLPSQPGWPRLLTSFANSSLISLSSVFKDRVIGFTNVVPNPEAQALPLTMELQRHAEKYSTGHAVSFEGYEAYLTTRVVVEAIRRAGPNADAERVAAALRAMGAYDMGGFKVSFNRDRDHGSDWLDVGLRSRQGYYLK